MLGVRRPLVVEFYCQGELVREETLAPWTGHASAECDRFIERRPER